MELLAPAGSMESLKAAIYAGADAVYLGGQLFNARERAANFTFEELREGVQLAHDYRVRIYITVNILTHDHELEQIADYLIQLADCGVDAFIIQDLGVAQLARTLTPQIELHASTQMTVHATATLPLLIHHGFKRVVLAREVTVEEIAHMHKEYPEIGLEAFAHGALCYAYSGQCLMSSMIGGRSGNRGACAGPCRLPYTLNRSQVPYDTQPYLMSPKDLCLIDDLAPLQEAGVAAIKIEGRLKRPEYVYTVVSHYRQALDRQRGADQEDVRADLAQAFNRGFTRGLILGERDSQMMGNEQPDNRGLVVAKVIGYDERRRTVAVQTSQALLKGDVLAWRVNDDHGTYKVERDVAAGHVVNWRAAPIGKGTPVNRVVSIEQLQRAHQGLRRSPAKFPLGMVARLVLGEPLELTAKFEDISITIKGNYPLPEAEKRPADEAYVCRQLGKLGNTLWYLAECEVIIEGNVLAPASELNDCRRRLMEELLMAHRKIVNPIVQPPLSEYQLPVVQSRATQHPLLAVAVSNYSEAAAAISEGADLIYWGSPQWQHFSDHEAQQLIGFGSERVVWRLPRISKDSDLASLEQTAHKLIALGFSQVMVDNLGQMAFLKKFPELKQISGAGIPVFNRETAAFLAAEGVERLTLSPELNYQQLLRLSQNTSHPLELVVHGAQLMMVHELCILKGAGLCSGNSTICKDDHWELVDRLSYRFPLAFDANHRSYVYNSRELSLLDRLEPLDRLQVGVWRLELAGRNSEVVGAVTAAYRRGIEALKAGLEFDWQSEADRLAPFNPEGVTHGHYARGV